MPPAKYPQVEQCLRKRIQKLEVGTKVPAVSKLSEDLGVSAGTIHKAIASLVQEGVLERRPHRGAFVSRPSMHTANIGVIWTDIIEQVTGEPLTKHPYTSTTLHAIQEEAAALGRNIMLTSNMDAEHPQFLGSTGEVGGVIILHNCDERLVKAYTSRGIPAVLVDPLVRPRGIPFVTTDHFAEFHDATQWLIDKGHERILHLTVEQHLYVPRARRSERIYNHVVEERQRGFQETMAEAGRTSGAHVHHLNVSSWTNAVEEEVFRAVTGSNVTACLCFNDDVAAWFLGGCARRGIQVPADMAVMGHDDTGLASRLSPSLTSIHIPLSKMGQEAVSLLVNRIEEDDVTGPGLVLPGEIVEREST
jgi:DNA-binding LacI/PurR family transcriptional regulator